MKTSLINKENFILRGGAGSGKTHSLVESIEFLNQSLLNPRIVCITYTNVAVNEIKQRLPQKELIVSTIHDFLWNEIKSYQVNLIQVLKELLIKGDKPFSLEIDGSNLDKIEEVSYENIADLENGKISHDHLLLISEEMFKRYPLLNRVFVDKYDYILVDEYQDTKPEVVNILLEHISTVNNNKLCIGLFGDEMQRIYEEDNYNIEEYIQRGKIKLILKDDNYRCSSQVIRLLNKLRSDLVQKPSKINKEGYIANKEGSAKFVYSNESFKLSEFKESELFSDWDFDNYNDTKTLLLTNKLIARELNFKELLSCYNFTDDLLGKDPDLFSAHLLRISKVIISYREGDNISVLDNIDILISDNKVKKHVNNTLSGVSDNNDLDIKEVVDIFHSSGIIRKNDKIIDNLKNNPEKYIKIMNVKFYQFLNVYEYRNKNSFYSTQHGIKGEEYENVLIVLDNGRWSKYNFDSLFTNKGKESVINRTKKLFYVGCSRAMDNLVVFYDRPSPVVIEKAKELFGPENVVNV